MSGTSPCLLCGACCATYRVSFYWTEALGLPEAWTERLTPHRACMVGTNQVAPRCIALEGTVGGSVLCTVYPGRPSPCRELDPGDERCDRARARYGLPPLRPPPPTPPPSVPAALVVPADAEAAESPMWPH